MIIKVIVNFNLKMIFLRLTKMHNNKKHKTFKFKFTNINHQVKLIQTKYYHQ